MLVAGNRPRDSKLQPGSFEIMSPPFLDSLPPNCKDIRTRHEETHGGCFFARVVIYIKPPISWRAGGVSPPCDHAPNPASLAITPSFDAAWDNTE
jgi:hypothetical protein